jgi:hypothetical protein
MALNIVHPMPGVVRPRPRVVIVGLDQQGTPATAALPGCMALSIASTNNFSGDKFTAIFAPNRAQLGTGSFAWWTDQSYVKLDLQIGLIPPGGDEGSAVWTTMLTGIADTIKINHIMGLVTVEGRDLTALLRDTEVTVDFANQTSSEIVTSIAQSAGLTAQVTSTSGLAGNFSGGDYSTGTVSTGHHIGNNWDAVVALARQEGYDAFVVGSTLHFQPPVDPTSDPWVVYSSVDPKTGVVTANVESLETERLLHIAVGVKVNVKSWHSGKGSAAVASVGSDNARAKVYNIIRPGLTQAQAEALAKKYFDEIMRHERKMTGAVPGDQVLTTRVMMVLQGTNTAADQAYYPVTITRHLDSQGYRIEFEATNISPEAQTAKQGGIS